jgi:hypothetical protein
VAAPATTDWLFICRALEKPPSPAHGMHLGNCAELSQRACALARSEKPAHGSKPAFLSLLVEDSASGQDFDSPWYFARLLCASHQGTLEDDVLYEFVINIILRENKANTETGLFFFIFL